MVDLKSEKAREIHRKSIVVDGLSGTYIEDFNEEYAKNLGKGGVTAIHVTVPDVECFDLSQVVRDLTRFFNCLRRLERYQLRLATTVSQIKQAKNDGSIAVVLGSQCAGFLGLDLNTLDFFARLGMRTMQPTYQERNQFGDGCGEKTDTGLSNLGVQWVEQMNRLHMVISLSHVGYKTSMEIMELSADPVVFDHSNPKILCDHSRNITDEQIRICGERDGVIGICPIAMFLRNNKGPNELGVDDYVDHIQHVVRLVGVDHVGIGLDLAEGHFFTPEKILERRRVRSSLTSRERQKVEDEFLKSGRDKLYSYELQAPWLRSVSEIPIITEALVARGYSDQDVQKILGGNFLRVFERVWGE